MVERIKSVEKRKVSASSRPFVYRYRPPVGFNEFELRKACKFKIDNWESRQEELYRLLDTAIELALINSLGDQSAGWIIAAADYYAKGFEIPEPDKARWLSPALQYILGAPTMKKFMKLEFVESKRERRLLKVR